MLTRQAGRSRGGFPVEECSSGLQRSRLQLAEDGERYTCLSCLDRQLILFRPTLQVELLLRGGPKGLHLADLQNVQLVYERPEAADELDKNPSRPAKNLAATEEKTATSSRSGRLVTNDMITDDTTANDSSLNASTSNSSRGTAAAAAKATAAATLGLRRSSRLAPTL